MSLKLTKSETSVGFIYAALGVITGTAGAYIIAAMDNKLLFEVYTTLLVITMLAIMVYFVIKYRDFKNTSLEGSV